MKKSKASAKTALQGANNPPVSAHRVRAAGELAGIFWRIVGPVTAGAVIGTLFDDILSTSPWLALTGVVIGFVVASLLVKRQFGYHESAGSRPSLKEPQK